jgi:hypothetical protein
MAPREKVIAALLRLQALGVTDEEIFNIYEWLNKIHGNPLSTDSQNLCLIILYSFTAPKPLDIDQMHEKG